MAGGGSGPRKKRNMGRNEYYRSQKANKRVNYDADDQDRKRQKIEEGETPIYATQFSAEDIAAEERRPKKKVAVLIGYSGTGYHGLQLSDKEKTIEGELFPAFVAAGAISKANAADPKKSSLVRCARTDKGVHAAGNVVSLKLIVEDPDIVQKINSHLSEQIRVWGILPTTKSFSSYQMCDSRIYEYLIPSHCFLPPHPSTFLGRKLVEIAEQKGDLDAYRQRQEEVASFWDEVDERDIKPIIEALPDDLRELVRKALHIDDNKRATSDKAEDRSESGSPAPVLPVDKEEVEGPVSVNPNGESSTVVSELDDSQKLIVDKTIKSIKAAYVKAKRQYRIHPERLKRVQQALNKYLGTKNFHNYTIQKVHSDPSSKRLIRSFDVNTTPVLINGTEWLSLKVHGQSFMMHQIRKMVAMMALVVRCGCDIERISESFGPTRISIPKAPALGLLLERPIFDGYNKKYGSEAPRKPIEFGQFEKEIQEFKQREIYSRIFTQEEETNSLGSFFNHIDHYPFADFLYVTSGGISIARSPDAPRNRSANATSQTGSNRQALAAVESDSDSEGRLIDGVEEGG